jgi:acetoin utilization protein AcuB
MKAMPTIQKYMVTMPHTIGADSSLEKAEKMMREYRIRHLPVLRGGQLVGVLSDRDVKMVETFKDVDPEKVSVEDAMSSDPYITSPGASLDEVAQLMADKKWGCALVVDNKKLVGIFTWVDALHAMGEILKQRFH